MRTAIALIAAFLLIAPAAQAKEITKVRACGDDGCVSTRDPVVLQGMMNGGPPSVPPGGDGAAYRLTGTITAPGEGAMAHVRSWWVPAMHMLVGEDGTWMPIHGATAAAFDRLTSGLTPIPGRLTGLAVEDPPPAEPAPARPTPSDDDGGLPWWPLLPAGAVLAAGAAALLRRRPRQGDATSGRPAAAPPA